MKLIVLSSHVFNVLVTNSSGYLTLSLFTFSRRNWGHTKVTWGKEPEYNEDAGSIRPYMTERWSAWIGNYFSTLQACNVGTCSHPRLSSSDVLSQSFESVWDAAAVNLLRCKALRINTRPCNCCILHVSGASATSTMMPSLSRSRCKRSTVKLREIHSYSSCIVIKKNTMIFAVRKTITMKGFSDIISS